jgi:mono/diheme cytochrome c family protein
MRRQKAVAIVLCLLGISRAIPSSETACAVDNATQNADGRLTPEEAKKLRNPISFRKSSIARGRILFIRDCTECHGTDGKSQVDVIANATDLTEPKLWTSGTSEGEIFRSIRDGAGDAMPPFKPTIEDEKDMWHLVNFIRSLWPEPMRPKLQEFKTN